VHCVFQTYGHFTLKKELFLKTEVSMYVYQQSLPFFFT